MLNSYTQITVNRTIQRTLLMCKGQYDAIRADPVLSKPLAGGAVHSHPEQEEQMHRDFDRQAYATLSEMEAYDKRTREMNEEAVAGMIREMGTVAAAAVEVDATKQARRPNSEASSSKDAKREKKRKALQEGSNGAGAEVGAKSSKPAHDADA